MKLIAKITNETIVKHTKNEWTYRYFVSPKAIISEISNFQGIISIGTTVQREYRISHHYKFMLRFPQYLTCSICLIHQTLFL